MRVGRFIATGQRVWRFEDLEQRITLSVTSLPDFFIEYLDTAADVVGRVGLIDVSSNGPQVGVGQSNPAATIRSEFGLTGAGQTVAVVDSGIAWDHIALGGGYGTDYRVVGGWDFTGENDADPYDDGPLGSHGTHVAGIIAADSGQVQGIAPGVDLVALRVFDDNGAGYFEWVEDALQWVHDNRNALANPITTVNLSLGASGNSTQPPNWAMLEDELAQLEADDIFVAVAAGNAFATFHEPGLSYPASSDYVVPVMSVDADGSLSDFSQRSPRAIAAPGRWVTSSVPDYVGDHNGRQDDFTRYSGTSMASPYVAGASVLVREAMQRAGASDVAPKAIYDLLRQTANDVYDSTTGQWYQRIDVAAAIAAVIPQTLDDMRVPESPSALVYTDLGPVDDLQFSDLQLVDSDTWYRVEAVRDGLLSIEARLTDLQDNIDLELYDAGLALVAASATRADLERIDVAVNAGDVYYVRAIGTNNQVGLHIANLVTLSSGTVDVIGTAGDDAFQFIPGPRHLLIVNGLRYELDGSQYSIFTFDGGAGEDRAALVGSTGNDIAILRPGAVEFFGAGSRVAARSVEIATVNGRRGDDIAYLHDSAGADTFVSKPALAKLYSTGYYNCVTQFDSVYGHATEGHDTAHLYDSAGDDVFRADTATARLSGDAFQSEAAGFERVYGYASDGYDEAYLYDFTGADIFDAETASARFYGRSSHNYAERFDRVYGDSSTGDDQADLDILAADETLRAEAILAELDGRSFHNDAALFARFDSVFSEGYERTELFGSLGNDIFHVDSLVDTFYRTGCHDGARECEPIRAVGGDGTNVAIFAGLGRNDRVHRRDSRDSKTCVRTSTSSEAAHGFDRIIVGVRENDRPCADVQQVDYVFGQLGRWA